MLFRIALNSFSCAIMQCLFAIRVIFVRQEILFGDKFHSARNFIRHKISFGTKFHSARNFIRHEISFGMALRNQNLTTGRERRIRAFSFRAVKTRENANSNMAESESFRQDRWRAISLSQEVTRLIGEEYE